MCPSYSHQSGSQGKGKRRVPRRDGGARKQRRPEWRKQAMHAVADPAKLGEAPAILPYRTRFGERPEHAVYCLAQAMARAGIAYYPEYRGRWLGFAVSVPASHREGALAAIARLENSNWLAPLTIAISAG